MFFSVITMNLNWDSLTKNLTENNDEVEDDDDETIAILAELQD